MKRNMSNTDRMVCVVIAVLFAYLYFGGMITGRPPHSRTRSQKRASSRRIGVSMPNGEHRMR
jgi:hypothetical protein